MISDQSCPVLVGQTFSQSFLSSRRSGTGFSVLRQVSQGSLTAAAGAERLGVTRRHFRRMRRRFEAEGDGAVVHGVRGRPSNRSLPAGIRERAMEVAADPLYRDFGPTLLAEHLERSFDVNMSVGTPRRWMLEDPPHPHSENPHT